ncbi:PKD domain-containing protein [Georgenia daeguensis]|uniref:PKD domain-containing protein n=1 Tax=Georgenia daeguensis TaxID=908355 RepID=A0ABP8EQE0_9MICO
MRAKADTRAGATRTVGSRPRNALAALLAALLLWALAAAPPAIADTGDIGYQGPAYNGSGGAPTADKPQSKLWFNDGTWWADMFDTTSRTFHIFRLDRSAQTWVDTGTRLDDRPGTRADVLWSGGKLYVASAVRASSSTANTTGQPARLYRFSYASGTKTYTLDPGFPVPINNVSSESLTLDRDSQGTLWATWTQAQKVYVNSTTTSDSVWGTPFTLPDADANNLSADDISALAAFGNNRVGLMWSNQTRSTVYVATHRDGDDRATWTTRVAASDPRFADDHINLRQLEGDDLGHLFAVVKTGHDDDGPTASQVEVLALNTGSGNWERHVYGTVADCHTRPMLAIDSTSRMLHVFATAPTDSGCPFSGAAGSIYVKSSPLDQVSFPAGRGTPVIRDADSPNMNDATGTKQNVTSTTGLVVLAGNDSTSRYWHADVPLGGTSPTVRFTATPSSGTAPLDVQFTDSSTGAPTSFAWDFGDGATSTAQNPRHTYQEPGVYTVTLTVTTASGQSASGNETVTVEAAPPTGNDEIAFGGSTFKAQSSATQSVTLSKPTGTSAGDVLVAGFTADNLPGVTVPAGWTPILPSALRPSNSSTVVAYYRVVTAADDAVASWTWTLSTSQKWGGGMSRYTGVDTSHPLDTTVATAVNHSTSAKSVTVPAVTTTVAGAMLVGGIGADGATPATTPPAGWTEAWESGGGKTAEHAQSLAPAAGSSGAQTWTINQGRSIAGWMTALRPAPPS